MERGYSSASFRACTVPNSTTNISLPSYSLSLHFLFFSFSFYILLFTLYGTSTPNDTACPKDIQKIFYIFYTSSNTVHLPLTAQHVRKIFRGHLEDVKYPLDVLQTSFRGRFVVRYRCKKKRKKENARRKGVGNRG